MRRDIRIEAIGDGLWALDTPGEESMYLIEGTERALLIDTGVRPGPLAPLLRTLTDKPIDLALTHAHIDHMYHAGEFGRVWCSGKDIAAWRTLGPLYASGHILYRVPPRPARPSRFVPLREGDIIDPGGCPIKVIEAPGHTPGSLVFIDGKHRVLFTGDAFGSGEAVWMWMPGCSDTAAYADSLRALLPKLEPYGGWRFLGGHRLQGVRSQKHPHGRTLCMDTARDMLRLCEAIGSGEAVGKRVRIAGVIPLRVWSLGAASMVTRRGRQKRKNT